MIDTILCHDKEEAKQYGNAIGWENIDDWYYNLDGTVTLILKIPVAELFTEELNGKEQNTITSCHANGQIPKL